MLTAPKLSPDDADMLSLKIAQPHRDLELEAMRARWWDYRPLHPTASTYLFASYYSLMHKTWWSRFIEDRDAEEARAFEEDDIFQSRDMTSVWLARQSTDLLGVPYPFVMEFSIGRALVRTFRHPLRPNQMYGEEFEIDLAEAWKAEEQRHLLTASDPFFLASNYVKHPLQDKYRIWLLARIRTRPAPHTRLLARLLNDGAIDDAFIEQGWPDGEMEFVRRYIRLLQE